MSRVAVVFVLFFAAAYATEVTPVEMVIKMISDMKAQTEEEGKKEAKTYDEFACFCKDATAKKSKSITDGQDNIDTLSATIEKKDATKVEKMTEEADRNKKQEELAMKLSSTKAELEKATAKYRVNEADMNAQLTELSGAIKEMEASKGASFLAVKQKVLSHLNSALQHTVDVTAFLQSSNKASVDPGDAGYQSHTGGTQDIVYDLQTKARGQKAELDATWEKDRSAFEATIKDTIDAMDENKAAIEQVQGDIGTLKTELSTAKGDLIEAQSTLQDDETYLHDLTERCAARANDWDQRSAMRRDELEALSTALDIIENKVKSADEAANKRAAASFIQVAQTATVRQSAVARATASRVVTASQTKAAATSQVQVHNVQQMLSAEAKRLKSALLGSLVMKVAADPFAKVKELIQKLIERLVKEAEEEASKKGFCDQELGKATHSRDSRLLSVDKITAELQGLEAKRDFLQREIEVLTQSLEDLDSNLKEQTKLREEEKAENLTTLKEAKAGLAAVTDALNTLKTFYRKAARASSFIQYSPVDDDTAGAGFKGSYKGNQEGSQAILGMLQTIVSDFERTIATTEKMEGDNAAAFTKLDRSTKADIAGKTTKKKLDVEDLATTKVKIEKGLEHMQENMNLLDEALKELEELKPACIDTGMSYKERVEKREDEMAALKKAMCMLDADGVEPDCK